jgi:hypothetical protein
MTSDEAYLLTRCKRLTTAAHRKAAWADAGVEADNLLAAKLIGSEQWVRTRETAYVRRVFTLTLERLDELAAELEDAVHGITLTRMQQYEHRD